MKAYVFREANNARIEELDIPVPREDEVLIKVAACGFCGTDIHTYKGEHVTTYPIIPGHEFSGKVVSIGKHVSLVEVGESVVADPNIFCEGCYYCKQNKQIHCENIQVIGNTRNGAFAEYVTVPERCVFPVPKESDMHAMAMAEPLACVINAHNKITIPVGGKVLIFGAGTIGILHLMIARQRGAAEVAVVDIKESQLETAKKAGADYTFLSGKELEKELKDIAHYGFDVIIEATGVPKVAEQGISLLANGGAFIMFGAYPIGSKIEVEPQQIYYRDLRIIGSYALQKTMQQSIAMIESGKINLNLLMGRKIKLEEMPEVFRAFMDGKTVNKTIVTF